MLSSPKAAEVQGDLQGVGAIIRSQLHSPEGRKRQFSIAFGGSMTSFVRRVAARAALFVLVLVTVLAHAQSTANVQGAVTDQSGAVVPNATVTITNTATGDKRTLTTDSAGNYQAPSLVPGTYTVDVSASGMAPREVQNVVLNVGATATVNVTL